ncbi:unnamed protein product [Ceutorhynchus assimilis]|uniref:BTB domain-containing protein n=1 Tax=Ceutorhynchus assimilis TaxID=467358 RepID=A0A9N9QRR5_9CUCU|nr:unnamed protein product [Ceutorhynchus assimilis]
MKSTKRPFNPGSGHRQSPGCLGYDPVFKRSVIQFAERKGFQEACIHFKLPGVTIKRWEGLKNEIMEQARQHPMENIKRPVGRPPKRGKCDDLDSMPLEKRLSQNHNELPVPVQETVLQSQSISPTKLKVTRQGRLNVSSQIETPPLPPEVCLKWNSQHTNMQSAFPNLLMKEQYVDATLVSEGKTMKCHRIVLSMCSPYFEEILDGIGPFQHPVLFMKDVPFWILKSLCDFMYAGEIRILQDKLDELLNVATVLKIKGLAGIPESAEKVKTNSSDIKQESESCPTINNKPPKLEEEEKPPPPKPPVTSTPNLLGRGERTRHNYSSRFSKHNVVASQKDEAIESRRPLSISRRREEKKAKLAIKEKEKNIEKIAPQKQQANISSTSKRVIRSSTLRPTHTSRRRSEKNKIEINVTKEKALERSKPRLRKDNINDPLDLLQPVYEEIAKDEAPVMVKNVLSGRLRERGNVPVRKGLGRKARKRRYKEDVDDSSPVPFESRKGTRSRPNVKVPKFFHTQYDDSPKDSNDATIVREPHTDQDDPFIEEVGEIKVEPVDVEENSLNWIPQDQAEEEEIMGNYDSPLVNIAEINSPNTSGVINIKQKKLQPVDINQFKKEMNESIITFNSVESPQKEKSEFMITNIHSMANVSEEPRSSDNNQGKPMEDVQSSKEATMESAKINKIIGSVSVKPLEVLTLDHRQSGTSDTMIVLPQAEVDPLAQIDGQQVNHGTGTLEMFNFKSDNAQIREAGQDISMLEKDHLEMATEDNIVQTQEVGEILLKSQEIVKETELEHIEEIKSNNDTALQIEETQTLAEEKEATETFTSPAVAITIKNTLVAEEGTFENLENLKVIEEETSEDLTHDTIIDPIEDSKNTAVEDSNNKENLEAPTRENIKQLDEKTSHLNKDNLEPLLSVETLNSEDIAPDIIDPVSHTPEIDKVQNNVEVIEVTKHAAENVKSAEPNKLTVETVAVLIQQETESNQTIEAELEPCLPSTSTTSSCNLQFLPIENNEDFTKDIELGSNLGDCESDLGMKEEIKSKEPMDDGDNETVVLVYEDKEKNYGTDFGELSHNNQLDVALVHENLSPDNNFPLDDEVDLRLEEQLLADLDEDIEMEVTTISHIEDDGTEKTLEMIVNDLNESLGEMKQ